MSYSAFMNSSSFNVKTSGYALRFTHYYKSTRFPSKNNGYVKSLLYNAYLCAWAREISTLLIVANLIYRY